VEAGDGWYERADPNAYSPQLLRPRSFGGMFLSNVIAGRLGRVGSVRLQSERVESKRGGDCMAGSPLSEL